MHDKLMGKASIFVIHFLVELLDLFRPFQICLLLLLVLFLQAAVQGSLEIVANSEELSIGMFRVAPV